MPAVGRVLIEFDILEHKNSENRNVLGVLCLCPKKDRKIEDEHINEPQFMEQQQHPRKLADAIKAERNTCAKNENEDTFQNAQKQQSRPKKGWIPTKFQYCKQDE